MSEIGPFAAASVAWLDVSAGAAGDMLCAALLDAGAPLAAVQAGVDAVLPGAAGLRTEHVSRAGQRATKLTVDVLETEAPHRSWSQVRTMLTRSALSAPVRARALAVFTRLAEAEGHVHGVEPDRVEFHEVGAVDSIADVVGTCVALEALGIGSLKAGQMALGSGSVAGAHGRLPVPVPAVLELAKGWRVLAGGEGELATPTGAALVTTLADECVSLPAMTVTSVGVGAGTREIPGRPNVVRVVVGRADAPGATVSDAVVLETNVDDLDPRLWPEILTRLLDAGASDAWLTPILMKKGRPAHTLSVLAVPSRVPELRQVVFAETSTIGLREIPAVKRALDRTWLPVEVHGGRVRMKVASSDGVIVHATPEFDDVSAVAAAAALPVRDVLESAVAAAVEQGLVRGRPRPAPASAGGDLGG